MACWTAPTLSPPWSRFAKLNAINLHRPRNILKLLVACVLKIDVELALHILMHAAGHADAAGFGSPSRRARYVDAIPIDVATINDDITDIDADAELDPADLREC